MTSGVSLIPYYHTDIFFLFPLLFAMRPRLNLSLRRALMAAMAAACTLLSTTAWGGVMHDDVSFQTYTDFGQNRGRYVVGSQVNELLSYIRSDKVDNGIVIHYEAGGSYTISNEQGMINFGGTHDAGHNAVISPNFIATVLHNGSLDGSFAERWVGSEHAVNYDAVDIRGSDVFRLVPDNGNGGQYDYMIQRQSKIVTDATWNPLTTLTTSEINDLDGSYLYHSGSGTQYVWLEDEARMKSLASPYMYIIGAINQITDGQIHGNTTNLSLHQQPDYSNGGDADSNDDNPLPNGIRPGDSGSPTYIFNTHTGQYEYIAAQQSAGGSSYGQARGDVEWTHNALNQFNQRVDLSATNTVYLNAIDYTDEEVDYIADNKGNSTQIYHGVATDAAGNELANYRGIQSGVNTWSDLSGIKNNDTWYAYDSSYLQQNDADLFFNDNLVFTATNGNEYSIVLNDTVDLGVGYVEFNKGEGDWEKGVFNITSAEGENNRLNSAGFVINEDAEVHLRVTNPDKHMTEWRKNGAGDLYIDGTGDTNALLTVGGSGTTYLQQTGGYAAYNVLASSGATVVIRNLEQIERDFTFGAGGGVLDMNGNSMDWYTSTDGEGRFTIHALTEEAIITNSSASLVELTYKESGNQTFKGSFVADSGKTLNITYDGGGTWTLNSIHTRLSANSSFTVSNGTVVLKGTNTVHGIGSTNGLPSGGRLNNLNDWHYADATMDVTVAAGATFELGSHARLTGMVYVYDGGTFVLREGVKHRYEYVEGGAVTEDTYKYAQFYGLHNTNSYGVYLGGSNASMQVAFSEGTTANTTIAAKLYGKGSISVAAGTAGGTLTLSGDNSGLSGTKTLISGGLIADTNNSLGNTSSNKWVVHQDAWIASHEFTAAENIFTHIDAASTGTLALSNDITSQLAALSSTHKNMTLGAEVGKIVNYGAAGTSEELTAVNGVWKLGGGGGELVVNFVLDGANTLMLGNHAAAQGTVTLTNNNVGFSGDIVFSGAGITLKATNENALGSARVALDYGNVLALGSVSNYDLIKEGSKGVLALAASQDVNLSGHQVTLGAMGVVEYAGSLSATKDGSYRIGGSGHLIFTNQNTFSGSDQMYIDGQGLSGSAVTFARSNAYTGNIVAGGGLQLDSANSSGDVTIHLGHRDSFASASSVLLQKGASLQFDGLATATIQNLSAQSGASLANNGVVDTTVTLNVTDGHKSSIVSNALSGNKLHLVKTGTGTLYMSSTQSESWTGGLTIKEGTVEADIHSSVWTNFGGVGSSSNVVAVEKGATLKLNAEARYGYNLAGTALPQTVVGSGTIELSSGGAVVYGNSKFDFDGTIKISDGTRLYVGSKLQMNNRSVTYNNLAAVNGTTVEIEAGSQVRVTSSLQYLTDAKVTTNADFIINGQGYTGNDSSQHKEGLNTRNGLYQADLHGGALSLDAASTVTGNITLATDAAIASWSAGNLVPTIVAAQSVQGAVPYTCHTNSSYSSYRLKGHLGGTVRGLILGVEEADGSMSDLTLVGNETLTFTADSANTYGDLLVAMDGNGNEDDKVALKLDGGANLSRISTALGTGSVTLNDGLILRLAGTGVADNSDVVYTYENNMSVGAGATLQSYNITNRLTGTVAMSGNSLNLATANGGVLELAGGISGSGTLNVADGSKVIWDSAAVVYAMARTGTPQFSGTVAAGAGADITLASTAVVSTDTEFTGTDSLTLRFSGTEDFTLGSISMSGDASTLSLYFDFSAVPDAADATTWNTLTVTNGITADSTIIGLTLNVDNDIASGSYALISGVSSTEGYSLADTLSGRLSLATEGGHLVLVVDADGRLYWRSSGENWNTTEAHWYKQALGDTLTTFSAGADVVFDASGVAQGNSAATPEQVVLNESVSVGKMSVKDSAYIISGTGAVAGQSLLVSGGAEAVLNLTAESGSSFSGGVTVDDATLTLQGTSLTAAATAQNGGTLALNSAAKLIGNVVVESGAHFTADAATLTGNLTVREADAALRNNATVSGNVSVREGNITITDSTVTGSFSGVGKGSAVLDNATLTTSGGWVFSELKNKFTLSKAASGSISWDVADGYLTLDSLTTTGNLSTTQDAFSAGEMVFLGTSSIGRLEGKMGALTIGLDADHTAFLTVTSAEFSDNNSVGAVTLNINEGSTFKVTSNGTQGSNAYSNDGIRIGEWRTATTVNVDGALLAANSSLHVGDSSSYVNIGSTGVLAVKGIRNGRTDKSSGVTLTMEAGGKLIVGSENVATNGAFTATLNGGTIASSANATNINGALTANGSLEIDTNRYDFAADGNSIARGTAASTITMQGSLSGECALTVSGSGKLALQNDGSTFTGSIALKDTATLSVNSTSAGILSKVSSLSVNSGTLDLSALDFNTEPQPTVALSAEASFSFTENSTVAFGAMNEDTWYSVFDTTAYGAALDGWESLSVSNFTINGVSMADMGRITLTTVEAGGLFYYTIDRYDLVWNGPATGGAWNTTDVNWQTTRPNAETGVEETISTAFVNNDNVTFNSTAGLQVAEGVIVNNVTIEGNSTVTLNGSALTANLVTIESGSKLKGAYASALTSIKAYNIAAGAELEAYVQGSPTFNAEVTGDGAVTMTGAGTLTWNAADGSLSIAELNVTGGGTFKTASDYTGTTVNLTNGGTLRFDSAATIGTMNVAAGKTATLWNEAADAGLNKTYTTVNLANGAILQTNDRSVVTAATGIGTLNLQGTTATLQDVNHSGYMAIDTLKMGDGVTSATLTLKKHASSSNLTIFELGAADAVSGNFAGKIELLGAMTVNDHSGSRSAGIILSNSTVAQNAVVSLGANNSTTTESVQVLGINVANATIAGLVSRSNEAERSIVFSGALVANKLWSGQTKAASPNTLTISTARGETNEYYGQVQNVNLVIDGEGTQKFLGTSSSFNGTLTVQGGTAAFNGAGSSLLEGASAFTLSNDGVLDLSAVTFSASGGIALGGAMSVSGGLIELGSSMTATDTAYAIFDLTADGASVANWESLKSNISVGGVNLMRYEGAALSLTEDAATLSFSSFDKLNFADLQWAGGATGTWDASTANWDRSSDGVDILYTFVNGDSVTFNSDAAVTLSRNITADTVTIADGATVSLDESAGKLTATSISVGEGAKLSLSGVRTDAQIGANMSGSGTVELGVRTGWNSVITMGSGFTGETHLRQGEITLVHSTNGTSTVGSKLVLLTDAADIQLTNSGSPQTWSGNLELRGTHDLHSNSNTDFTFTGNVSGTGTYTKISTGKLTFGATGTVNLGGFTQSGDGETIFAGATTLNGLNATAGSVSFGGATTTLTGTASATTLNLTGGTMKVNFTSASTDQITDNANGTFTVGTLNYTGGVLEMSGTVNITTLKVGTGLTATVYNKGGTAGQNKTFGTVELGNGAILKTYDNNKVSAATDFGTLKLMGDFATIQDHWHAGYYHVDALTMGIGVTSSILELKKTAASSLATVFELGNAGDTTSTFAGKINLNQSNVGKGRSAFVVLSNANIAQNAVISMTDASNTTESAYIGLGINADNATIAGLESNASNGSIAKLFSGTIGTQVEWTAKSDKQTPPASVGDVVRTLNITTKASGKHAFYGEVLGNLNLVIDGEGTQKFLGTSSSFNGTLMVQGGTAAFNEAGSSLLEGASAFTLSNDGVLDLSAIAFGTDAANAITLASGATFTFDASLDNDADLVIDLGELQADMTYQIFDTTTNSGTLVGWNQDTLDLGNFRINGDLLANIDGDVSISLGEDGSFSYSLTDPDAIILHWKGDATGTWDTTSTKWDATPDVENDALVAYTPDSLVVFNSSAELSVSGDIEAQKVTITDGATLKLKMTDTDSFAAAKVHVENGKLALNDKNWIGIESIELEQAGVLQLEAGSSINQSGNPVEIMMHGGKIVLLNGNGGVLNTNLTVDGSGTIEGSYNGLTGSIKGSITGTGTLTLLRHENVYKNPFTVDATISDKNAGSPLALHVTNGIVKLTGTNTYTGGTIIGDDGTLTITNAQALGGTGTNGVLGKVRGGGTLVIDLSNGTAIANGTDNIANVAEFTGTFDVTSGTLRIGSAGNNESATDTTINADKIIVRNGAMLMTNFGNGTWDGETYRTLSSDLDLMSGSILKNVDGCVEYSGNIRFNVKNDGSYDTNGSLMIDQHWRKILYFSGLLEGAGMVKLTNAYKEEHAIYNITGSGNTFAGTFTLSDDDAADQNNRNIVLRLGSQTAAQYATINLASEKAVSKLQLDSDATIAALNSTDADNLVTTDGAYTLTVSSGSFAGMLQNGSEMNTLALTKQGNGKLTLSGANTYTGKTTVTGGTLELQGAGKLGAGDVSISAGAALTAATTAVKDDAGNVTTASETWARITASGQNKTAEIQGASITQTEAEKKLSIAARTAGTAGSMVHSMVEMLAGTSLTVENMIISGASSLRGQAQMTYAARNAAVAQASLVNSTLVLSKDNSELAGDTKPMTLTQLQPMTQGDTTGALTLSGNSNVLTVTSSLLSNLVLTSGTNFVVDFSSLLADVNLDTVDFVELSFAGVSFADISNTQISGVLNPTANLTAYYNSTVGAADVRSIYFDVRAIPEPTTTTLSILALAGLALRRRRR